MSDRSPLVAYDTKTAQRPVRKSAAAAASLVFGALGFCCSYLTGIPGVVFGIVAPVSLGAGILGLFFGIVALARIGNDQRQVRGWTVAVTGLILSCMSMLWLLVFLLRCTELDPH